MHAVRHVVASTQVKLPAQAVLVPLATQPPAPSHTLAGTSSKPTHDGAPQDVPCVAATVMHPGAEVEHCESKHVVDAVEQLLVTPVGIHAPAASQRDSGVKTWLTEHWGPAHTLLVKTVLVHWLFEQVAVVHPFVVGGVQFESVLQHVPPSQQYPLLQ